MKHGHVILEGKPTTGKSELSALLRIFFPEQVVILPELTTELVRANRLNILEHRRELTELLVEAVPARAREVERWREARPGAVVLEESHMGVHWAYSNEVGDRFFLDCYHADIAPHVVTPDLFLRLEIPTGLSVRRQVARATKDVEVDGGLVDRAFGFLDRWHSERGTDDLVKLDTNRPPPAVLADTAELLGLEFRRFEG